MCQQQEGGNGMTQSNAHVSHNAYVKQVPQGATPCTYANRTMLMTSSNIH